MIASWGLIGPTGFKQALLARADWGLGGDWEQGVDWELGADGKLRGLSDPPDVRWPCGPQF